MGPLAFLMGFGSTALKAIGVSDEANAQRQNAEFNAGQADILASNADFNARLERETGAENERRVVEYGYQLEGSIRAAYGASGVTMDGTPSDYVAAQKAKVEQTRVATKFQSFLQSQKYLQESKKYRAQAEAYRQTAGSASSAGTLGILATGASGLTSMLKRTT